MNVPIPDPERLKRGRAAVIDCRAENCDKCFDICGFSAISRAEGRPYSDPNKCIGCGGCASFCPEGYIRLVRDRQDGTFEVTFPFDGELPELGGVINENARVVQTIPKRPGTNHALVRAIMDENGFEKEFLK